MSFDTMQILQILSQIHEDLDTDTLELRFFDMVTQLFDFDRLALFFIKHRKSMLQGKLSHGFAAQQISSLEIPLSDQFILTKPLVTGLPVWRQAMARDPYLEPLGLSHFAVIPVLNRRRVACWEVTACQESDCPAYGNSWLRCWRVAERSCGRSLLPMQQPEPRCASCPIYREDNAKDVEGVLLVDNSPSQREIADHTVTVLSLIGQTVGSAINHAKRLEHTRQESVRDEITGIHNRRYFDERLRDELERVRRYPRTPASLVLLDIDLGQQGNDSHAPQANEAVLVWLAQVLAHSLRKSDLVARFGDEEFALLLVNTPKGMALAVAEDLRRRIEADAEAGCGLAITVSVGVATCLEEATTMEQLLGQANQALTQAKAQGRNRGCQAT